MVSRSSIMDEEEDDDTKKSLLFINNKLKNFLEILRSETPPPKQRINPYMRAQLESVESDLLKELNPLISSLDTRTTYDLDLIKFRRKYLRYRQKIVITWELIRQRSLDASLSQL